MQEQCFLNIKPQLNFAKRMLPAKIFNNFLIINSYKDGMYQTDRLSGNLLQISHKKICKFPLIFWSMIFERIEWFHMFVCGLLKIAT